MSENDQQSQNDQQQLSGQQSDAQKPQEGQQDAEKKPWGKDEDFDPDKAWKLIQGLKADKEKLSAREAITPEQKQQLAEWQQWQAEQQTELERANSERERWQSEAENWRTSAMSSRVQALAVDFADPSDAVTALAENNYLDAGGVINDDAIRRDLDEVLTRKPHWRRPEPEAPKGPRAPAANPAQGTSGTPAPSDPREVFASMLRNGTTR